MYKVLDLNWSQLMDSEYVYKSNHVMKVAEFDSSCFHEDDNHPMETFSKDSIVIIYYDSLKAIPIVLCERIPKIVDSSDIDLSRCNNDNFVAFIDYPTDEECTDIILTRRSIVDAISQSEN